MLGPRAITARGAPAALLVACALLAPRAARAGGFELPDNGTQALGRGAAFVAKADDPSAIYHNPAGLARQRGTRALVNGNLVLHSFEFQRSGAFPDDPEDPATPWGGKPYPLVRNTGGPFFAPFLAIASDFGVFDRLTFGLGVFGPPAVGNRTFPLGVQGAPAASRYDFVQSRSLIVYPTASAAYRVTPWLDLGLSAHLVVGRFDQTTISYADAGQCKNPEYQQCDSRGTLVASGNSFAATLGALVRPDPKLGFGLSFRTPVSIEAQGTVSSIPPAAAPIDIAPGRALLTTELPWMLRTGARYVSLDGDFELYDLELDVTYEAWGSAQGDGPRLQIPELGQFKDINTLVVHRYKDTFSVRAGGAYNLEMGGGVLSVRAGGYFDSPATEHAYTRLDFDTLAKVAGTFGLGYKTGAFTFDFAYAAVASVPRVVGTGAGDVRPINGAKQGQPLDANDQLLPAVNEGAYRGFTNIFSFGVTVSLDAFLEPRRPVRYGNPYEPGYAPAGAEEPRRDEPKEDEPKREEPKEDEPKREDSKADEDEGGGRRVEPAAPAPPAPTAPKKDDEKPKPSGGKKPWWEELDDD